MSCPNLNVSVDKSKSVKSGWDGNTVNKDRWGGDRDGGGDHISSPSSSLVLTLTTTHTDQIAGCPINFYGFLIELGASCRNLLVSTILPGHFATVLLAQFPFQLPHQAMFDCDCFACVCVIKSHRLTFSSILHEWMRTQMLAKPSSNLLQRTGGDHRGGN